jgi:hypothetical protein
MLNCIVSTFNMLKAFYSLDEWKPSLSKVAARTAVDWDGVEIEAAAPSALLSFNVDDLYTLVVDGFQSFVNVLLPFGPWLLPMLSLCVGMIYMLGVRPVERLNGLTGISRCTAATFILAVSFLAAWSAPVWFIVAAGIVTLAMQTEWNWIYWTMCRLVDLLCGCACLEVFVFGELDMPTLVFVVASWASVHVILIVWCLSCMCVGEWVWSSLTFPLAVNLQLVWWAIRNVLALARMGVVAVCSAAVAVATGAANGVQTVCSFFYEESVRAVNFLSTARLSDLDQLSCIWRCTAAIAVLSVSVWTVWTAPAWAIIASVVVMAIRTGWDWIFWTMRRLVDLLFGLACLHVFLVGESNMPMLGFLILLRASDHLILSILDCLGEWAVNSLTFPLVVNLQLAWWAVRTASALLWMAVAAVCGAAVAGATGAASGVRTICSFFLKGCVRAVSYLSAVHVLATIEFTFMASLGVAYSSWYYDAYTNVNANINPAAITAIDLAPVPKMARVSGEDKMVNTTAAFASSMTRDCTGNMDSEFAQDVEAVARNAGIFVGAIADRLIADFPHRFDPNFHDALAFDAGQLFGAVMNAQPFAPN